MLAEIAHNLRRYYDRGAERLAAETRAAEMLDFVGLGESGDKMPHELSGGMQQRVALARALVRRRKILLLDEAFAALGPALRAEMIELVKNLVAENAMTALLVSHQPRDALLASARTAFVNQGRIAALEATADLLENTSLPAVGEYLGSM